MEEERERQLLALLRCAAAGIPTARQELQQYAGAPIAALPAHEVRDALQKVLLGPDPEAVLLFVETGALRGFGFAGVRWPLPLSRLPAQMLLRWWGFLLACGVRSAPVVEAFGFSAGFGSDLARLNRLYFAPPPATCAQLKLQLREPLPQDAGEVFAAFAALDERFAPRLALYEALRKSGEPYTLEMLAIRPASLLALGVPQRKVAPLRELLLDAVLRAPQLNHYDNLAALAMQLAPLAGGGR